MRSSASARVRQSSVTASHSRVAWRLRHASSDDSTFKWAASWSGPSPSACLVPLATDADDQQQVEDDRPDRVFP
jgi:hypothetical protein